VQVSVTLMDRSLQQNAWLVRCFSVVAELLLSYILPRSFVIIMMPFLCGHVVRLIFWAIALWTLFIRAIMKRCMNC